MTDEIYSLKNDQIIGLCYFRKYVFSKSMDECKSICLQDERCFGIVHSTQSCIDYWYEERDCSFPRDATYFIHKGNLVM